ncbi:PssD/Cps14F family polysaccharide biosynthesis glycosyltransferase [Peribacillus muralis]|uniref:PssD/Cps14F family polysaccharide biosynthesis glycosyltransferase n=1 Tax=Peribacillus muralis TaxID=264697 RepID=UPI003D04550E
MCKVALISSTGGHWTQLNNIINEFNSPKQNHFVELQLITEKNETNISRNDIKFLVQQDRKKIYFLFILIRNLIVSIFLFLKFRPDYVISTGAGVVLPYLFIAKIYGSKIIFIESYAKVNSPTITGRIVYRFADIFYVQWPSMLRFYPNGIYKGSLY